MKNNQTGTNNNNILTHGKDFLCELALPRIKKILQVDVTDIQPHLQVLH